MLFGQASDVVMASASGRPFVDDGEALSQLGRWRSVEYEVAAL
jgi:hypothetical protein